MKNNYVLMGISATLVLIGCVSTKDLSQMQANVNTASQGDFGRCMEALYTGAVQLGKAQEVLREGQEKEGKIFDSEYEEGLRASENAVRERQAAEQACNVRVAAVEQQVQSTEQQVQRTKEVLRGVTFVEGSAMLTEGAKGTLDVVANRLLREPTQVEVQGHTSSTGSLEFNMNLSEQRAEAVRKYLVSLGVPADSVTAKGYGPTQPVASNDTPEGRRANQRVELRYLEEIR
jgi:outer membrane protein OmpA-like peptidoglycan-associated protein